MTDPGSCPIGAGGSAGIVGPACRALATSQCLAQGDCGTALPQCALKVQSVADVCKFPCIGIESGSTENMEICARCVYNAFASNSTGNHTNNTNVVVGHGEGWGPASSYVGDDAANNVTGIQTCCGCLPSLFEQLPGGFIPSDVLPTVMQSPCKMHDPLQDDDANMDDDEVTKHSNVLDAEFERTQPSFAGEPLEWVAAGIYSMLKSISTMLYL